MLNRRINAKLASSEEGAVLIEYGLLLVLIAAALIAVTTLIGNLTLPLFNLGNSL